MRVYHFLSAKWALDDLLKSRLKISLLDEMNDPFELLASDMRDKKARELFDIWRAGICNLTGVLCFSDGWHDPLLWSHYADRHRGVALAFEVEKVHLTPVTYAPNRLPDIFTKYFREEDESQFLAEASKLLAMKYKRWEYESEHRLFAEKKESENGRYFFEFLPHLKLKTVMLGVRFEGVRADFEAVLKEKYRGVELMPTRMAFKSFQIVRQKQKKLWIA